MRKLILTLSLAFVAVGCGGDEDYGPDEAPAVKPKPIGNEAPLPPPTSLACPRGTRLTYENFGQGFVRNFCNGCHAAQLDTTQRAGAPLKVDFDTYQNVIVWRAGILAKAGANGAPMPPINNVPSLDRAMFAEWLNCGAPQE